MVDGTYYSDGTPITVVSHGNVQNLWRWSHDTQAPVIQALAFQAHAYEVQAHKIYNTFSYLYMFIADSCLINWYKQINYFASADIVFINIYHLYEGLGNLHDA